MIRKSRVRLFVVGVLMLASMPLVLITSLFWIPYVVLLLTGCYLIVWATFGKGALVPDM